MVVGVVGQGRYLADEFGAGAEGAAGEIGDERVVEDPPVGEVVPTIEFRSSDTGRHGFVSTPSVAPLLTGGPGVPLATEASEVRILEMDIRQCGVGTFREVREPGVV